MSMSISDSYNAILTDCVMASDGEAGGNGTAEHPLSWAAIKLLYDTMWPGVTVVFRGGTYAIDDNVNFSGNPNGHIVVTGRANEATKINGSLWMERDYSTLKNMEIYDADLSSRATLETGSNPSDIPQRDGVRAEASNIRISGMIIHDTRQGLITTTGVENIEIEDCIVFYNGWSAPDRGHGHGLYTGTVLIKNCIVFDNFGYGLHGYMGGDKIIYEDCIVFGNGEINNSPQTNILVGGNSIATNFRVENCQTYFRSVSAGSDQFIGLGSGGIIRNNVFVAKMIRIDVLQTNTEIAGNKIYGGLLNFSSENYPDNEYLSSRPDTGLDVYVHQFVGNTNKASVAVYNWAGANSATVDLSTIAGLSAGDSVTIRNVQDYFVDIQTLTLDENKCISVDMQAANRSVSEPIGWTAPATTFPTFGCFVVEKLA